MEFDFKLFKKIMIIIDITIIPSLIYLSINGNNTIAEWIVISLANIFLIYKIIKDKKSGNE